MNEYGKDILRGISQAARDAGILDEAAINGSTEDNFKVSVTSLGITVIGELNSPLPQPISKTCAVYLAGLPKYGADVILRAHEILTFDTINKIMSSCAVHDFIPVGSKGIAYELSLMQDELCAEFAPSKELSVDITASGGPATCAIFASHDINAHILREIGIPVTKIGELNPK
jgi:hypothetical protein